MSYNIGFDVAHKERAVIDQNYSELRDHLNSNDFICYNFLQTPITQKNLKPYDILVFACPDFAKISRQEIMEIEKWVTKDGGGLLLLSHAGGDKGRNSNLSELSQRFGILFENDQVLDETNNIMDIENMPSISNFIPPHPITEGVNEICYRAGCSLSVVGDAFSIASSNDTSEPFSCPLMCVAQPGNGRVCAIGSYEMFRSTGGGGFQYGDHSTLILNVFNWLISDYRMELETKETIPLVKAEFVADSVEQIGVLPSPIDLTTNNGTVIEPDISKIATDKGELIVLLRNFLNQINNMKDTIERLIEVILVPETKIFPPTKPIEIDEFIESNVPLSDLPPKPSELQNEIREELTKLPQMPDMIKTDSDEIEEPPLAPEEPSPIEIPTRDELESELETLENKLKSISNLLNFIEKKHTNGKLSEKSYKKQKSTLEKDIETINRRIKEINNLLD